MKRDTVFKCLTIAVALFANNASAYEDDKKKEACRQPKVQEFTLPEYSEANKIEASPEAEFSFVVSGWANPKKFKLFGKGKDIPFTVQSTDTYHKVKAKLLPEFTGHAVRISVRIPALLECYTTMGWLVKIADKAKTPESSPPASPDKVGVPTVEDGKVPPKPDTTTPPAAETSTAPVEKAVEAVK